MCLAVPGKILEVEGNEPRSRTARVAFGEIVKPVSLACLPAAAVGDYVLVHAGFAISVLDQAQAERTLADLRELEDIADHGGAPG